MGMVPERRHPIDSYMGYIVFKNGLPVAYAVSWILFNSARIGLNVFYNYRGGEAKYIFDKYWKYIYSVPFKALYSGPVSNRKVKQRRHTLGCILDVLPSRIQAY